VLEAGTPHNSAPIASRWFERLATLTFLLGLAFVAIFVFFALRAKFPVPFFDDWAWLASLFEEHPLTHALWRLHNEHIIVIPRLLLWMDFWLWGWPGYATLSAALLSHVAVVAVFVSACRDREPLERRLVIGAVLALTFLTYALQGTVFPASVLFPLVSAFATLAIRCVTTCAVSSGQGAVLRWACLGSVMSVAAMLCLTSGLMVPFILAMLAFLLRLPLRITAGFLTVGFAGVAFRYALGGVPATVLSASPMAIVRFALAMLAGPVASVSPRLAVWVCVLRRFVRTRTSKDALLVGILAFVVASAAMASLARAQFDPSVAAESRYSEVASVGWASLLLWAIPSGISRRPTGVGAAALISAVALVSLPLQVFVGQVWAAKADYLDLASLALAVDVSDEDWLSRLHPLGASHIEPVLPQLRARNARFLDFPMRGERVGDLSSQIADCDGRLDASDPDAGMSHLRVHGHIRQRGALLRILDTDFRVRGLAKPAPGVTLSRANANEFVWAALDDLVPGRPTRDENWFGFAAWGAGPPFQAELLDRTGRPLCRLPMACCREPEAQLLHPELVVRGSMPEGWLDSGDCALVSGWAWDGARPNQPMTVRITISNGQDIEVIASGFRPDLLAQKKGNGRHAFALTPPALALAAGSWRVDASIADTGVPLMGSPKTIVCP
jgi:hypothetical protein